MAFPLVNSLAIAEDFNSVLTKMNMQFTYA